MGFVVCSFSSTDELTGKKRTYRAVKLAVVKAGRFSTFEATQSDKDARLFTKLCKDPDIETFELGFPWMGVRWSPRVTAIEVALVAISKIWSDE